MSLIDTIPPLKAVADRIRDFASADDEPTSPNAPAWLDELRRHGREHFDRVGFPGSRDEEWRQVDIRPITRATLSDPADGVAEHLTRDRLAAFAIPGLDATQLTFVDGRFQPQLSDEFIENSGVSVSTLAHAVEHHEAAVKSHLGRHARADSDPFTALNTARFTDGAFIHVEADAKLDRPVLLLFVSTDTPAADGGLPTTHPRVMFHVEHGGEAHVIEHHVTLGGASYLTNTVTEVVLGERAHASHTFIERDSRESYNISTLQVYQATESDFHSHTVLLGGKLVRNNVNPVIDGENCHTLMNGLYLPDGERVMDNHMLVHHKRSGCDSRQYYTGVMRDRSKGVFAGRINVDRAAQQTDAVQSSRGLLLGDDSSCHYRPQLEIFADDVKCTHGATIGEIDERSIFYLRSRGIPEEIARGMLVFAFANEALDRIDNESVRKELARLLIEQLSLGDEVAGLLD